MRVFLAVHPGERFGHALSERLDAWSDRLPVRWTRATTRHLTLQFLGDWPEERLAGLRKALHAPSHLAPFSVTTAGMGAFPNLHRPRVLFLQIAADGRLADLAANVRRDVAQVWPEGPQDTKEFRAHITLARVREPLGRNDLKIIEDIDLRGLPKISVEGFSLVASELRPEGARHRDLAFYRLRKKGE